MKREEIQNAVSRLNQKGKLGNELYDYIISNRECMDLLKEETRKYDKNAQITDALMLTMIDTALAEDVNYLRKKLHRTKGLLRTILSLPKEDINMLIMSNLELDMDDVTDREVLAKKLSLLRND